MTDCVLYWNGSGGKVVSQGILFEISTKPELGFEYETMSYEPTMNAAYYTLAVKDENNLNSLLKVDLSEAELTKVQNFCNTFMATADYEVAAYNTDRVFVGVIMKSLAIEKNLKYSITERPPMPMAKYNETTGKWEPIFVAFKEDGFPMYNVTKLSDDMVMFFTETEWKDIPKQPSYRYSLDFKTLTWMDKRELERVKTDALMTVRVYYEHQDIRANAGFRTPKEMVQWVTQYNEAKAFTADPKASTPFLDGFLSKNPQSTKEALCAKILEDYTDDALFAAGAEHGEMYNYVYRIKSATTNAAVDAIVDEVNTKLQKYKVVNYNQAYPSAAAKEGEETIVVVGGTINHGIGGI